MDKWDINGFREIFDNLQDFVFDKILTVISHKIVFAMVSTINSTNSKLLIIYKNRESSQ